MDSLVKHLVESGSCVSFGQARRIVEMKVKLICSNCGERKVEPEDAKHQLACGDDGIVCKDCAQQAEDDLTGRLQ